MKLNIKALIVSVAIPLAVGGLSAAISQGTMENYQMANQPPLTPPAILFPIVWTILYTLMGIASYLIYTSSASSSEKKEALRPYISQLIINFFWSIFFFNLSWYLFSFLWLLLLWANILICIIRFLKISKPAAYLMIPYLLWVSFAGYLNLGVYLLN